MKPLGQCDYSVLDRLVSNDQSRDSKETCFVLLHSHSWKSGCTILEGGSDSGWVFTLYAFLLIFNGA